MNPELTGSKFPMPPEINDPISIAVLDDLIKIANQNKDTVTLNKTIVEGYIDGETSPSKQYKLFGKFDLIQTWPNTKCTVCGVISNCHYQWHPYKQQWAYLCLAHNDHYLTKKTW